MEGIGLAELDELAGQAVRAALTSSTSVCDTSQCAFPSGHAMWLAVAPRELEDPIWRALGRLTGMHFPVKIASVDFSRKLRAN